MMVARTMGKYWHQVLALFLMPIPPIAHLGPRLWQVASLHGRLPHWDLYTVVNCRLRAARFLQVSSLGPNLSSSCS